MVVCKSAHQNVLFGLPYYEVFTSGLICIAKWKNILLHLINIVAADMDHDFLLDKQRS